MPSDVDKSLLDRLAALRGSSAPPEEVTAPKISVDTIERAKTPTREDALAARLKSLRAKDAESSPSSTRVTPGSTPSKATPHTPVSRSSTLPPTRNDGKVAEDDDVEAAFRTDDATLEELLGDVGASVPPSDMSGSKDQAGDDDAKVRALLEELSHSIPQDSVSEQKEGGDEDHEKKGDDDSDDSDGEKMTTAADVVIARLRDEMEVEAALSKSRESVEDEESAQPTFSDPDLALPSVPQDPESSPSTNQNTGTNIEDITARLSALRASSEPPGSDLPSVPTSKPTKDNPNRLKSRTNYTDDDMDSWCIVCLEDATLRCLGCEDENAYCNRCWREMHVGRAAGFDDWSHKAVQFDTKQGKEKKKKVALGAV